MVNSSKNQEKIKRNSKTRIQKEKWNEKVVQISRVTKVCKGGKN